jgi:two-component system response regulator NreC
VRKKRLAHGKIRVLLADDHPVVRKGLLLIINAEDDMEIIGEAANGREAVEKAQKLSPHIILMDINMPIMNGIEATKNIRAMAPDSKIIGLSMCEQSGYINEMKKAGAIRLFDKTEPIETILKAIREVC